MTLAIKFGRFNVAPQVFYQTKLSFALVNLKPLVKGHVLVCPKRPVTRVSMMEPEEASDFYMAVHHVSKAIEAYYKVEGMNITIQDGPLAGQSVPHVHCHVIPRRMNDMPSGNVDQIYSLLDGKEGDLDAQFETIKHTRGKVSLGADNDTRKPRTDDEMAKEATELYNYFNSL